MLLKGVQKESCIINCLAACCGCQRLSCRHNGGSLVNTEQEIGGFLISNYVSFAKIMNVALDA